jgi:hypothetical protein
MSYAVPSAEPAAAFETSRRNEAADLEIWKHLASSGGTDKNTMITVTMWLLAFSATALGYIGTETINSAAPGFVVDPDRMMAVSLLGLLISLVATYVTLLYGGYSNRNWAKADCIARAHGWRDLLPASSSEEKASRARTLVRFSWDLARPCNPETTLAPVFVAFAGLAALSAVTHFIFLCWSFYTLLRK